MDSNCSLGQCVMERNKKQYSVQLSKYKVARFSLEKSIGAGELRRGFGLLWRTFMRVFLHLVVGFSSVIFVDDGDIDAVLGSFISTEKGFLNYRIYRTLWQKLDN